MAKIIAMVHDFKLIYKKPFYSLRYGVCWGGKDNVNGCRCDAE